MLEVLPHAMNVLEEVFQRFGTHMSREACESAQTILRIAADTRNKGLQVIHRALAVGSNVGDRPSPSVEEQDWALYFDTQLGT